MDDIMAKLQGWRAEQKAQENTDLDAGMAAIANAVLVYYRILLEKGLPQKQAWDLTIAFQGHFLGIVASISGIGQSKKES